MIDITFEKNLGFDKKNVTNIASRTLELAFKELKPKKQKVPFYVSVLFTNNKKIKEMNLKYKNIKKSTNVLSFPQNIESLISAFHSFILLGDIVVSLEKIKTEAIDLKKSFSDHLSHIVLHGLLHLMGYGHENNNNAELMESAESEILSKLSIQSPYDE